MRRSGGDTPTELPKHDFICTDESELIQFTSLYGESADTGEGAEAVLDAAGKVIQVRGSRGGTIPKKGSVLDGTGDLASITCQSRNEKLVIVADNGSRCRSKRA
ncbi:hypothetical protein [Metabacillus sp. RGM 3146]|uniref:hypothetical protein n=1 Tax=Metabacillus sp. RGM 3146 TaxID=3401092 RepID=UPI003B9A3023